MSKQNRVISSFTAVVDGEVTGLAGCNNPFCTRDCLRKDSRLVCREQFTSAGCSAFIRNGSGQAEYTS